MVLYIRVNTSKAAKTGLKKVFKKKNFAGYMKEVEILKMIDHPNVLKFYETFEDETNLYIVTELCHGGDLMD